MLALINLFMRQDSLVVRLQHRPFPVQAHIYILNGHGFGIVGGSKLAYVPVNNPFMWRSGQ